MATTNTAAKLAAIVAVLKDENGEWRELQSCADAIQDISLIIAGAVPEPEPAPVDYTPIVEQMRTWAEKLAPILEGRAGVHVPTVAIVAQLQAELHQTADDLASRGVEKPEPPTCPDCGSFLTDRTTTDDGRPNYCDSCDRMVRDEEATNAT